MTRPRGGKGMAEINIAVKKVQEKLTKLTYSICLRYSIFSFFTILNQKQQSY